MNRNNEVLAFINLSIMIFKLLFNLIVYSPLFGVAIYITEFLNIIHSDSILFKYLLIFLLTYLIYCLVFFIKGITISLKVNYNNFWIVLFIFSFLFTCLLPTYFFYEIANDFFIYTVKSNTTQVKIWSVFVSLFLCYFVYKKYDLHTDTCPRTPFWAYSLGFKLSLKFIKTPIDITPDKSNDLI